MPPPTRTTHGFHGHHRYMKMNPVTIRITPVIGGEKRPNATAPARHTDQELLSVIHCAAIVHQPVPGINAFHRPIRKADRGPAGAVLPGAVKEAAQRWLALRDGEPRHRPHPVAARRHQRDNPQRTHRRGRDPGAGPQGHETGLTGLHGRRGGRVLHLAPLVTVSIAAAGSRPAQLVRPLAIICPTRRTRTGRTREILSRLSGQLACLSSSTCRSPQLWAGLLSLRSLRPTQPAKAG